VIVFVGATASEGSDRTSLDDYDRNSLVETVAQANPATIVVLSVPGAVVMPWSNQVQAILTNFLPGQQGGNAIADVLFGAVNPSARLPVTMPNGNDAKMFERSQYPGVPGGDALIHTNYSERLLVGYRHYDMYGIPFTTGFPFGHGLSYTSFGYSNLSVVGQEVSCTVANTGLVPGAEVVQLYLAFPVDSGEPLLQLKGFRKTAVLGPGQAELVTFALRPRDFSIWDTSTHAWAAVPGRFEVNLGASSRDLRLIGDLDYEASSGR